MGSQIMLRYCGNDRLRSPNLGGCSCSTRGRAPRGVEILASVDRPHDANWEAAWLVELNRHVEAANARGSFARAESTEPSRSTTILPVAFHERRLPQTREELAARQA
jgi:hypothetical protein